MRRTLIASVALSLALLLTSCVHIVKPQEPSKPPPPVMCGLIVHVFHGDPSADHKVPGARVEVAGRIAITDGAGNATTLGLFADAPKRPYLVSVTAEGYLPVTDQPVELCAATSVQIILPPIPLPPVVALPRLVVAGQFFALENGQRFTAIQASDFNLLARYLAGEDIEPILTQRAGAGFNMLRVWTLYRLDGIGTLLHPDYLRISVFLQACARHGLYVEFTAYTSTFDDGTHWTKLIAAVQGSTNVLTELVNENSERANTINTSAYARPIGVLASHGSNGSEQWGVLPAWNYETFHTNDASEWWRKVGHNAAEIGWEPGHGKPVLANENTRFCDRDSSLAHAYDAAAGAALLAAGSAYHSVSGKASVLWIGCELEAARAWAAGAKSVPLHCQSGPYYHRADLETPDLLRVYQRGDDPACIVHIRK